MGAGLEGLDGVHAAAAAGAMCSVATSSSASGSVAGTTRSSQRTRDGPIAALDLPVVVYGTAKTGRIAGRVVAALSQLLKN
jgi:hypothetical protein